GVRQAWDSAGRRSSFGFGSWSVFDDEDSFGENFAWQADGLLASLTGPTGIAQYGYTTAGQITSRTLSAGGSTARTTFITSRDGAARPLTVTNRLGNLTGLGETLTWRGDGVIAARTLVSTNFTDNRAYFYADGSRRLIEERLNLDST